MDYYQLFKELVMKEITEINENEIAELYGIFMKTYSITTLINPMIIMLYQEDKGNQNEV